MVRASAYPTVEWLTASARHSVSRPSQHIQNERSERGLNLAGDVLELLQGWKSRETRISRDVWIRTPNGDEPVDLMIERKRRRIGIRISRRYERDTDQSDALVLVYGRFDTLYRVSADASDDVAADLAYALVSMVPNWFSAAGRRQAGRKAGSAALVGIDRLAWGGRIRLPGGTITRIRLSRASDWVSAFESALSVPRLSTFAPARGARLR
jgi:hypothetical protein